jgi:RNA polymerase sigma factor (TIGR02999 family)
VSRDTPITVLLQQAEKGDSTALDEVVTALYEDLKRRAATYVRRYVGSGDGRITLQPTALVNETYLQLLKQRTTYANRGHFLAIATRVMLRVLVDHQRAQRAKKRGGEGIWVTLSDVHLSDDVGDDAVAASALSEALDRLEALDARKANAFKLRAIWGIQMAEIAEVLDISLATAERDWRFARSWLADELAR